MQILIKYRRIDNSNVFSSPLESTRHSWRGPTWFHSGSASWLHPSWDTTGILVGCRGHRSGRASCPLGPSECRNMPGGDTQMPWLSLGAHLVKFTSIWGSKMKICCKPNTLTNTISIHRRGCCSDLMHADVALITEHHLVVVLAVRWLADIADHVLIVLDAEPLLCFHGVCHVFMAAVFKLLHHPFHGDLIQRRHGCTNKEGTSLSVIPALILQNIHFLNPQMSGC